MNTAEKHQRADTLKVNIEDGVSALNKLKLADEVEVSNGRRGYLCIKIPPHSHTTDTLGEIINIKLADRLGKNERQNRAIMFVQDLIDEVELELDNMRAEYDGLFSLDNG